MQERTPKRFATRSAAASAFAALVGGRRRDALGATLDREARELPSHGSVLQRHHGVRDAGVAQRLTADDAARAPGAVHNDQRVWARWQIVDAPDQLRARHVDAAGNIHAVVFLERTRVHDDDFLQLLQALGSPGAMRGVP